MAHNKLSFSENKSMPSDQTPLLQRVAVAPPRQRYPHQRLRYCCTIALATACIGVALVFVFYNVFSSSKDEAPIGWPAGNGLSYEDLRDILDKTPDNEHVRRSSQYYAGGPHLAGKNLSQAEWTRNKWQEYGVKDSSIVSYEVYINYPVGHRLALLESNEVTFEARLEEDVLEEDSTSGLPNRIPTFHGYSASGNVTGQYVYVNYGSFQDFQDLQKANVSLAGKIALAKYGGNFRGLKVKRAQELGMIGVLMYSDPGDDSITEQQGHKPYPHGPARAPSSVQRGSTQFISVAPGDPTTPGYPSKPGVPRQDTSATIPRIPSLPISYMDALPLLIALNGHGPAAASINQYWKGGGLGYKGVDYFVGPSPPTITLNLVNEQEYTITPLWNVIGIINGTLSDEVIILGNHRDAWIAGGAGDPNSGSAALNEVVRSMGKALDAGWKPLRTIVFASWDGEEYGLVGSTEWVEEYLPWLSGSAVAYLNVDVGTDGSHFHAASAPLLDSVLIETTKESRSVNQEVPGQSVHDVWDGVIKTMGSGSDFTAFQDYLGAPCIDMGFTVGEDSPIYHYHSNYDSFDWMQNFGDPSFDYHVSISKMWALLAIKLIETPIIPFNATNYAIALNSYLEKIKIQALDSEFLAEKDKKSTFKKLDKAIAKLYSAASALDAEATVLSTKLDELSGYRTQKNLYFKLTKLFRHARQINYKYKNLERQFLYQHGLDNRSWFKHTVFAPGRWTGYSGATYPGLVESIEDEDKKRFRKWLEIITKNVRDAAKLLE